MSPIIDGKKIADKFLQEIKQGVEDFKSSFKRAPGLTVLLVGDNKASQIYVRMKAKKAKEIGINANIIHLSQDATQTDIIKIIEELNNNNNVDGILIQLPLPKHLDEDVIVNKVKPEKDVDGFTYINVGRMLAGQPSFEPCTPKGIMYLLKEIDFSLAGAKAVVIGRSRIVGRPMAELLINANATVTICHSKTTNLKEYTKNADLVITAVGNPEFLDSSYFSPNATVIDVGINKVDIGSKYKIVGDVKFDEVYGKVKYITPVPGGVGPMTIACLMANTLQAAQQKLTK